MDEDETLAASIGDRIRAARKARGISTAALAAAVGVGEAAIKKLESGGSGAPSFGKGLLIAKALDVTPWFLAFGADPAIVLPAKLESVIEARFVGANIDLAVRPGAIILGEGSMDELVRHLVALGVRPPAAAGPEKESRLPAGPTSDAIQNLQRQIDALEEAVREIRAAKPPARRGAPKAS